jgi:Zn-dependent protease with chaperone function
VKFDPTLPEDGINVTPSHPLSELALLVGGSIAVVAGLFLGLVLAVDLLVPLVPPSWEAKLFADFGPDELDEDPRQASASLLLERLLVHVPESPFEYRLAVLEEERPNALAFPGGLIVLTTGLLDGLESENELAMVVGHELGHYAGRDHLEGLGRGLALSLVIGIVSGAGDVAGIATLAADMALRGHGREEELRADAFGLELVHAEYGHVAGATAFFERLPSADGAITERLAEYLSTHPMSRDRIDALAQLAQTRGWPAEGALVPVALAEGPPRSGGGASPDAG